MKFEAPMAVYLLVVLERNKQLSVVPIISVLSFFSPVKGQTWILPSSSEDLPSFAEFA